MDVVHEGVAANTDAGRVLAVGDGQCRVATAQLLGTLPVAEAAVPGFFLPEIYTIIELINYATI